MEFVYPLLIGAGLRYEHLLADHLTINVSDSVGVDGVFFEVGAAGLSYYFNDSFHGLYASLGVGYCLIAVLEGNGGGSIAAPLALGFKTSGRGFYIRPEIAAYIAPGISDAPVIPVLSVGFGGNWGGSGGEQQAQPSKENANSLELGTGLNYPVGIPINLDYERMLFDNLAVYLGPKMTLSSFHPATGGELGATCYFFKPFENWFFRLGGTYLKDNNENGDLTLIDGSIGLKASLGSSWYYRFALGGNYRIEGTGNINWSDNNRWAGQFNIELGKQF